MDKTDLAARQTVEIIPLVMRTLAAELRQTGHLPAHSQFSVLVMLAQHDACNLSELAEQQSVSLPSMSNTVSKLVERGWVERRRSAEDRRQILIRITGEGRVVLLSIKEQAEARIKELLKPLTGAERDALLAGLSVLSSVFSTEFPAGAALRREAKSSPVVGSEDDLSHENRK